MSDKFNLKFWQPQLQLVAKLSSWIAFPVLLGAGLGHWLDKKFSTAPWLFFITIGLSFVVSMVGLVFNTIKEYQKISPAAPKHSPEPSQSPAKTPETSDQQQ